MGHIRHQLQDVVVVYQFSISNVMYTGDIEALFVLVLAVLETHPLLRGTYPIITSPWPGLWQVHTHYGIQ